MDKEKSENYEKSKDEMIRLLNSVNQGSLQEIKDEVSKISKLHGLTIAEIADNYKEGKNKTMVHFAAARGDVEIMNFLAENKVDLNIKDEAGNNALLIAAQHDNVDLCKYLIEEKKFNIKEARSKGNTILHIACETSHKDFVEYLLNKVPIIHYFHEKGATIDSISDFGTPLELSLYSRKTEIALFLLSKGANPNGSSGKNPEGVPPPLFMAIGMQDKELFTTLINSDKTDINVTDQQGWSSLQYSAEVGNLDFCKILVEKGADPNYECQQTTALDLAFQYNQMECVVFLRPLTHKSIQNKTTRLEVKEENLSDLQVNEEKALEYKGKGNELYQAKKYKEAIEQYDESLKYNRSTKAAAPVYTNKAICLIMMGQNKEALEAARHAKNVDPTWIKAYVREAQAYYEMREYGEAAASYFEGLKLEPTNDEIRDLFKMSLERGREQHDLNKKH